VPELWNAVTGKTESVSYQIRDGRTIVPLKFESWDAYFIVFKDKATAINFTKTNVAEKEIMKIEGNWTVTFNNKNATFEKLTSWSENTDTDIKYFSGTATYKTVFNSPIEGQAAIDLGDVKNVAEVIINGKFAGIVWKKPFKIAVDNLKMGKNTLEVKITNLWVNRLVGDAQPDVKTKTTFTTMPFHQASSPLLPSGLLGPVRILAK
jgi:hypothetical protein